MMTQYTSLTVPDPAKCIRDLELYIDAISVDIFRGGNVYTVNFAKSISMQMATLYM